MLCVPLCAFPHALVPEEDCVINKMPSVCVLTVLCTQCGSMALIVVTYQCGLSLKQRLTAVQNKGITLSGAQWRCFKLAISFRKHGGRKHGLEMSKTSRREKDR